MSNRYELESAAHKIDGYYNPQREKERYLSEFERARNECADHLRRQLSHVEQMSIDDFVKYRK